MSKPLVIDPKEYAKARSACIIETQAKLTRMANSVIPSEQNAFICPGCYKDAYVRHEPTHYCLPCYIPKTLFSECDRCGKPLHVDNDTGKCLNKDVCK
ncbi:MAG: hypothetical protein PHC68_02655 [Syntrophorhabdaceae bacterium]|nr:hypothetical protein [Syntrophorhabdaceae bacterium]